MALPVPSFNIDKIPRELKQRRQWVCWRYEEKDGKMIKVPLVPRNSEVVHADVTDPNCLGSFEEAVTVAKRNNWGIGFVFFKGAGIIGIDIDDPQLLGVTETWEIVKKANSYTERSVSGRGLHIYVKGKINEAIKRKELEIYNEDRFFVVTGDHIGFTPMTINDAQSLLDELVAKYGKSSSPVVESKQVKDWETYVNKLGYTLQDVRERDETLDEYLRGGLADKPSPSEADMGTLERLLYWGYEPDEAVAILKHYRPREKLNRQDYIDRMLKKLLPVKKTAPSLTNPANIISAALSSQRIILHPTIDYCPQEDIGLIFCCPIDSFQKPSSQKVLFMHENAFLVNKNTFEMEGAFYNSLSFAKAEWLSISQVQNNKMLLVAQEFFKNNKIEFPSKNEVFKMMALGISKYYWTSNPVYYTLIICWAIGTWFFPIFQHYPILNPQGERETGKTTLLEILGKICWNPTPRECALREAGLFRTIQDSRPTYIIDITKLDPRNKNYIDVIDVCEAGTEKGGVVKRVDRESGKPEVYQVYSPKAIATRYELPFIAKCIRIISEKASDKTYAQRRHMLDRDEIWGQIVELCFRAALKYWREVKEAYENMQPTEKLYGRFFNYWAPILSVCKVFAPDKYNELLSLAEEYAQTQTAEDELAEVETAILTFLMRYNKDQDTMTITLRELTEKVKELVPWIKGWQIVKSALENLHIVARKYTSKRGATYQLNLNIARKKAEGRILEVEINTTETTAKDTSTKLELIIFAFRTRDSMKEKECFVCESIKATNLMAITVDNKNVPICDDCFNEWMKRRVKS